jgi:Protein of unknown function (DUF5132)
MRIQPFSFVLGVGVALVIPLFSKVIRPLAVEAMAAGLGFVEEGRRLLAEQMEVMEDIAAEARARRETIVTNGNGVAHGIENGVEAGSDAEPSAAPARGRRRGNGPRRQMS